MFNFLYWKISTALTIGANIQLRFICMLLSSHCILCGICCRRNPWNSVLLSWDQKWFWLVCHVIIIVRLSHNRHCDDRGKFLIKFDILGLYWGCSCSMFTPTISFTNIKKTPFTDNNILSLLWQNQWLDLIVSSGTYNPPNISSKISNVRVPH